MQPPLTHNVRSNAAQALHAACARLMIIICEDWFIRSMPMQHNMAPRPAVHTCQAASLVASLSFVFTVLLSCTDDAFCHVPALSV